MHQRSKFTRFINQMLLTTQLAGFGGYAVQAGRIKLPETPKYKPPISQIIFNNLDIPGALGGFNTAIQSGDRNDTTNGVTKNWEGLFDQNGKPINRRFDLSYDDPRYQAGLRMARIFNIQYRLRDLDQGDQADYAEIVKGEKIITQKLMEVNKMQYGKPGASGVEGFSVHNDWERSTTTNYAGLREFKSGEPNCRHFTAVDSAWLTEAGALNFEVTGYANIFYIRDGKVVGDDTNVKDIIADKHSFMVSQMTAAVWEMVHNHMENYLERVDDTPPREVVLGFVRGDTLILSDGNAIYAYGTGKGADLQTPSNQWGAQIIAHDLAVVSNLNETIIQPALKPLRAAVEKGDARLVKKRCEEFLSAHYNFRCALLDQALQAAAADKIEIADIIFSFGKPTAKGHIFQSLIKTIQEQKDIPLATFLIRHGALDDFDVPVDKASVPFWGTPRDPAFNAGLIQALGVTPESVAAYGRKTGRNEKVLSVILHPKKTLEGTNNFIGPLLEQQLRRDMDAGTNQPTR